MKAEYKEGTEASKNFERSAKLSQTKLERLFRKPVEQPAATTNAAAG